MARKNYQRRFDLDWLRVLAFALLILFHTGMMFNNWDWHVKNPQRSAAFEYVMIFLHQWRMPLLFFISGAAVWFAMEKYAPRRFAWERIKRLLLPLVFGMFVVIPPQVYFERLFQGRHFSGFTEFYTTILDFRPYPEGNFSWHHLWYIPYIFTFSLLMLLPFAWFKTEKGRALLKRVMDRFASYPLLLLGSAPLALSELTLRPFWPENRNNLFGDWAQFTTTLIIFTLGFCFASSDCVWPVLERNRMRSLLLATGTTTLLYLCWYGGLKVPVGGDVLYRLLQSSNLWFWIVSILGFGYRYLRFSSRLLSYATGAVYPFYILHQTITVVAGYYLAGWNAGITVKFLLLALITFLGSWLLYEFPIRRMNLLRPAFGLKLARPIPLPLKWVKGLRQPVSGDSV